jgi:hypothetical protein
VYIGVKSYSNGCFVPVLRENALSSFPQQYRAVDRVVVVVVDVVVVAAAAVLVV